MKYFDTTLASANGVIPSATTWAGSEFDPTTFLTFCVPVKGTGINERIGRHINIHKVKIHGRIACGAQANQTVTDAACIVRMIMFVDTQTNAAQAQGEQLMDDPGTAAGGNTPFTFMSLKTLGRFRVLKDKTITIQNPNISWDGTNIEQNGLIRSFKFNHTFRKPLDCHFNATDGGTIADIVDNSIHLIATCTSTALVPTMVYEARVSYKDPS